MHTPTNFDQTDRTGTAPALRYDGAGPLAGVLSRNEIVAEYDNGTGMMILCCNKS
jgi:hypothetical protein